MENNFLNTNKTNLLSFLSIAIFYFFESAQMSYFNILAPYYLKNHIYFYNQIAELSAAYYYGNMIGLIPVGIILDKFPLRTSLLWAILGSIIGAFLLLLSPDYHLQWMARFICGFFGGSVSFVGGIRVITCIYKNRFSIFISLFIASGMLGGLISQYPLLAAVNKLGSNGVMIIIMCFGVAVGIINLFYLKLPLNCSHSSANNYRGTITQMFLEIIKNFRNWLDCLMIVLLDTPVSIIGTLWGIVLFSNFYHLKTETSSWIVMSLFAGLIIGSPLWGIVGEKYNNSKWIIFTGTLVSFISILVMLISPKSILLIVLLTFILGIFSSCQTIGFTWLIRNMNPELIGRNSAFNSMIFMGANGLIKQLGATLLVSPALIDLSSAGNLLVFIFLSMVFAGIYILIRDNLFKFFMTITF